MAKRRTFNVELSDRDRKRLDEIATHAELKSKSDAVRVSIREKHDRVVAEQKHKFEEGDG